MANKETMEQTEVDKKTEMEKKSTKKQPSFPMRDIPGLMDVNKVLGLEAHPSQVDSCSPKKPPTPVIEDDVDLYEIVPEITKIMDQFSLADSKKIGENEFLNFKEFKTAAFSYTFQKKKIDVRSGTWVMKAQRQGSSTQTFTARIVDRSSAFQKTRFVKNEYEFLMDHHKTGSNPSSQIRRLLDIGYDKKYLFMVFDDCGTALDAINESYVQLHQSTCFMLAYQSFMALKEMHEVYNILHLDVNPLSFLVKMPFRVYICGFLSATKYKERGSLKKRISANAFSPRIFHDSKTAPWEPEKLNFIHDYESWCYTMIHISIPGGLPWAKEPVSTVLKMKETYMMREKNIDWRGTPDFLCVVPTMIRGFLKTASEEPEDKDPKHHLLFQSQLIRMFSVEAMQYEQDQLLHWGHEDPIILNRKSTFIKKKTKTTKEKKTKSKNPK